MRGREPFLKTILQLIATELADLSWWLRRMIQRFRERTGVPMLLNTSDGLRPRGPATPCSIRMYYDDSTASGRPWCGSSQPLNLRQTWQHLRYRPVGAAAALIARAGSRLWPGL